MKNYFLFISCLISSLLIGCASSANYHSYGEYYKYFEGEDFDLVSMQIVYDEKGLSGVDADGDLLFDIKYNKIFPLSANSALTFTYKDKWSIERLNGRDEPIQCIAGKRLNIQNDLYSRIFCIKETHVLADGVKASDMALLSEDGEEIILFPKVLYTKGIEGGYEVTMQHGVASFNLNNELLLLSGEGQDRNKLLAQLKASMKNASGSEVYLKQFPVTDIEGSSGLIIGVRGITKDNKQNIDILTSYKYALTSLDNVLIGENAIVFDVRSNRLFIQYQETKDATPRTKVFDEVAQEIYQYNHPLNYVKSAFFTRYSELKSMSEPMLRLGKQQKPLDKTNPYLYQPIGYDGKAAPLPEGIIGLAPITLNGLVITWVTVSKPSIDTEYRMGGNNALSVIQRYNSLSPLKSIAMLSILETPYQTVQGYDIRSLMTESLSYMLEPLPVGELKFPEGNNKWVGTTPKYTLSNGLSASTPELAIAMRIFDDSLTQNRIEHEEKIKEMHRKQASKLAYDKKLRADTDLFWSLINQPSGSQSELASLANTLGCDAISAYINRFGKTAAKDVPKIKHCAINLYPERKVVDAYTPQDWSNSSLGLGGMGDARSQAAKDEAYRNALEDQILRSTGGQGRGAAW